MSEAGLTWGFLVSLLVKFPVTKEGEKKLFSCVYIIWFFLLHHSHPFPPNSLALQQIDITEIITTLKILILSIKHTGAQKVFLLGILLSVQKGNLHSQK